MGAGVDVADGALQIRRARLALDAGVVAIRPARLTRSPAAAAATGVIYHLDVLGDPAIPSPVDAGLNAVTPLQILRPKVAALVLHGRAVVVEQDDLTATLAPIAVFTLFAVVAGIHDDDMVAAADAQHRALHVAGAVLVASPATLVATRVSRAVIDFYAATRDHSRGSEGD